MNEPIPLFPQAADREPPHATEAEISVLGACLIDEEATGRAVETLTPAMFYREAHRRIFATMVGLYDRGEPTDPTNVAEAVKHAGELEQVGGLPYLAELMDAVATAGSVEYHARLVERRWRQRQLIAAGTDIVRLGHQATEDVDGLLDEAEARIMEVGTGRRTGAMRRFKEAMAPALEHLERLQQTDGGITGVSTGFRDLDERTGGFQPGDLILLAARPSMGKTALACQFLTNAALEGGVAVGMFSVEMSERILLYRMAAAEAVVDLSALLRGRMADDDYVRLTTALGHLHGAPIWIDEKATTVLEVRAKARRLKAERPDLGLLVVDYIQLMQGRTSENRNQEVSEISRGLKGLAKELDLPVVALSQLSRKPEERGDKRPHLSDLRDSGSLEQDADVVLFLHRPEYYLKDADAADQGVVGYAELNIGKQRNGPTGTVELYFRKESTRFEDATGGRR